ncbi:hypothetical protein ACHHYP_01816 [Achlya hypogyna]|uniref:WW domain-containing protein n=1 Tax=Achlya hypogyna TaxID=1202772 RepID=A0A1V9Z854_ACHHY|nr:hypothetical protein ACHHYP_01816 [Achlya hypogyna]
MHTVAGVAPSPSKRRLRDLVEAHRVADCVRGIEALNEARAEERLDKYYSRWRHFRALHAYASSTRLPPLRGRRSLLPSLPVACFEGCVTAVVPAMLVESMLLKCLGLDARDKTAMQLVQAALNCVAAPGANGPVVDYRRVCATWDTLEYPLVPPKERVARWFLAYASTSHGVEAVASAAELTALFTVASTTPAEEAEVAHCLQELVADRRRFSLADIVAYMDSHPWLPKLVGRQVWCVLPDETRLKYHRDKLGFSVVRVEQEQQAVRLQSALRFWALTTVRRRFGRWKEYAYLRHVKRLGMKHRMSVQLTRGLAGLRDNRRRRRWMHARVAMARRQYERRLQIAALDDWVFYWSSWQQLHVMAAWRGTAAWPPKVLADVFRRWVDFAKITIAERIHRYAVCAAKAQCLRTALQTSVFQAWVYYVVLQRRDKQAAAHQDAMVARSAELARVEREVAQMKVEEAIAREMIAREKKAIERARAAAFRVQTEQIVKLRQAREAIEKRTAKKLERQQRLDAASNAAWAEIERMALEKARAAAIKWLETPEGKAKLLEAATYMYETDPSTVVAALQADPTYSNVPNCVWVCRLEVLRSKAAAPKAYYMHLEDLNKVLCVNLTMKDCDAISREQFIQTRVNETMAQLAIRGAEEKLKVQHNRAAKTIQLLFRCRQAKKYVRGLTRAVVMRRIDPSTGIVVYYNTMSRTTSPTPPRIMGSAEATLPMESLNWVRRMNEAGDVFYFNQESLETSWTPPDHYVLCHKCRINFVTQRHAEKGHRYCVSCFAESIFIEREEAKARRPTKQTPVPDPRKSWTKVVVQAAKCVVCKTTLAAVLCHECTGDTTCQRCFTVLHSNAKLKHHTQHESLLHTSLSPAS